MMDTYGFLFRNAVLPLWEGRLRGRRTLEHLRRLERTQGCSLDELEALQSEALARLIEHAQRHVPYYRDLDPVRDVHGLAALPLLTREAAASSYEQRRSTAGPLPEIAKMT